MVYSQIDFPRYLGNLLLILLAVAAACKAEEWREPCPAELERLYRQGMGTPAEYLTRLLFYRSVNPPRKRFLEERGIRQWPFPANEPESIAAWQEYLREVERGLKWRTPPPEISLPYLVPAPEIDGVISSGEWRGALFRSGELPIGAGEEARQRKTRWFAGMDERWIYFATECNDGVPERGSGVIYENDCVELFLRPDPELPLYWEFIGNPFGEFSALHMLDRDGTRVSLPLKRRDLWKIASTQAENGFSVEFSIARSLLWRLEGGQDDRAIRFVMVRIRRGGDGVCRKLVPFPFLYDGHNVFGYAVGVMLPPSEAVPGKRGGSVIDELRVMERQDIIDRGGK